MSSPFCLYFMNGFFLEAFQLNMCCYMILRKNISTIVYIFISERVNLNESSNLRIIISISEFIIVDSQIIIKFLILKKVFFISWIIKACLVVSSFWVTGHTAQIRSRWTFL